MPHYFLGPTCPHCSGNGQLPATHPRYRVFHRYQDSGWGTPREFDSAREARKYVKKSQKSFFGSSTMFLIVAPNGEILT